MLTATLMMPPLTHAGRDVILCIGYAVKHLCGCTCRLEEPFCLAAGLVERQVQEHLVAQNLLPSQLPQPFSGRRWAHNLKPIPGLSADRADVPRHRYTKGSTGVLTKVQRPDAPCRVEVQRQQGSRLPFGW